MAEYLRFVIKTNFIFVEILLAVLSFDCPPAKRQRGKRAKSTYHLHETHCDKYYKCRRGVDREETCPDGMRFNLKHANFGRKCVLPQEGASCGGLTEFQPAQPNGPCKRQNGYFVVDGDETCRKYFQCTDGVGISLECPAGTAFAVKNGNCDWPDNVKSCNLEKLYGFKCPDNYQILILKHGPNVKFADPNDCRTFFTCGSNAKPRKLGCPLGRVFNGIKQVCDEPEDVEGWFNYYKSSEEEFESEYDEDEEYDSSEYGYDDDEDYYSEEDEKDEKDKENK
ncbi:Protein obstructor-E [Nymphon striatum]|nr:Protein obstructor-E [Nymphon striatum]